MELIVFTLVAVSLYFLSDWSLRGLEKMAGRRFEQRTIIFFAILLLSALIAFSLIRAVVVE